MQEINGLTLNEKTPDLIGGFTYSWTIDLLVGHIKFKSSGYTQMVRSKPIYMDSLWLSLAERGGVSFETQELTG